MSIEEYITIQKASEILGVSYAHIYTLEKRGLLRIIRKPGLYRSKGPVQVPLSDVERLRAKLSAPEG